MSIQKYVSVKNNLYFKRVTPVTMKSIPRHLKSQVPPPGASTAACICTFHHTFIDSQLVENELLFTKLLSFNLLDVVNHLKTFLIVLKLKKPLMMCIDVHCCTSSIVTFFQAGAGGGGEGGIKKYVSVKNNLYFKRVTPVTMKSIPLVAF